MKKILLVFLFFPAILFSQQDTTKIYHRTLKTNVLSPWLNYQTLSLSFEHNKDYRQVIEYKVYYHFGRKDILEARSLSFPTIDIKPFSGGASVAFKYHRKKHSRFYWGYEGGYQFYNLRKTRTICTEVDTSQERICPCTSFTENVYNHKINQLSIGFRSGWQTPLTKYFKRVRFELFYSLGARIAFGKEIGKLDHVFCSPGLEADYKKSLLRNKILSSYPLRGHKESFFAPYFNIGLKFGYAF